MNEIIIGEIVFYENKNKDMQVTIIMYTQDILCQIDDIDTSAIYKCSI